MFFVLAAFVVFLYREERECRERESPLAFSSSSARPYLPKNTARCFRRCCLLTDYYWNPGFSFEGIRRNWKLYVPIVIGGAIGVA